MARTKPFDNYTNRYEDWFTNNRFAYESELLALKKLLPASGTGMEVGVGSGKFAVPLRIRIGIDPSVAMLSRVRNKSIHLALGTGENIPIQDESLDFVLVVTTICFFENITNAIHEISRILKSGGSIIIGMVNRTSPLGQFYLEHKDENVFYRDATFYSVEEVIKLLSNAKFKDFSFTQTLFDRPEKITAVEPVLEGYDKGSFVAIRGIKEG